MENGFIRKPSGLEAFFIDLDAGGSNMTIHFYLELTQKPRVSRLRAAFKQILSTHAGVDMRFFQDAWYTASCEHDCPVIDVVGSDLTAYTPDRLDYCKSTVDLKVLHATESDAWYLCFDFFHGVMDGRSAVQFVYDFFDVLNKREHLKPEFKLNVCELLKEKHKAASRKIREAFTVFPECAPYHWKLRRRGKDKNVIISHKKAVGGIAAHYANTVSKLFNKRSAKMIIPVDVRRHAEQGDKSLYGNLFVPMFLDAARYDTWSETHDAIRHFVKHREHIRALAKRLNIYSHIPTRIRQFVIRRAIPLVMTRKKFIYCALVSSLGIIESKRLRCEEFAVKDCSVSLVAFPFAAFSVISLQYEGHTNTSISWHSGRVPEKIVKALVREINDCMMRADAIEA